MGINATDRTTTEATLQPVLKGPGVFPRRVETVVRPTEGLGAVKNFGADDPGGFYAEGMAPRVDFVSQDPMNNLRPPKATSGRGANHPVSKFTPDSTFPKDDNRSEMDFHGENIIRRLQVVEALREPLTSGGRTMAQGALAYIWALDPRMVPIPGFKSVEQVRQNAGAMEFGPLGEDEFRQVQEIVAERLPTPN